MKKRPQTARIARFIISWGYVYRQTFVSYAIDVPAKDISRFAWNTSDKDFIQHLIHRIPKRHREAITDLENTLEMPSDITYIGSDVRQIKLWGNDEPHTCNVHIKYHDSMYQIGVVLGINYTAIADDGVAGHIHGDNFYVGYDAGDWRIMYIDENSIKPLASDVGFTWTAMKEEE